jgi:uncharacterized membrane protein YhhN
MPTIFRVVFVIFSAIYLVSLSFETGFSGLLKILPILTLSLVVAKTTEPPIRHFLLVALFFSACGDLLLNANQFIFGVVAFLMAQLSYAFLFVRNWQGFTNRLPISLLLSGYMGFMLYVLLPNLESLLIPVIAYLMAIGFMGFAAIQSKYSISWSVLGAMVFIASDSLIAIEKFIQPIAYNDYWIMATYYLAQWMLIEGFLKENTATK